VLGPPRPDCRTQLQFSFGVTCKHFNPIFTSHLHNASSHRICRFKLILIALVSLLSCVVIACLQIIGLVHRKPLDLQKHKEALEQKISIMARFVAGHLGSTFRAVQSCVLFCWLTFIAGAVERNYLTVFLYMNI